MKRIDLAISASVWRSDFLTNLGLRFMVASETNRERPTKPPTQVAPIRHPLDAPRHGPHDHRAPRDGFLPHLVRPPDDGHRNQHDRQRILLVP